MTSLTWNEFWLLHVAVDSFINLQHLEDSRHDIECRWMIVHHGMPSDILADTLISLHNRGMIYCFREDPVNCGKRTILRQRDVCAKLSDFDPNVFYGLTQVGGVAWENSAKPNWSLFFHDEYFEGEDGQTIVKIQCASERQLKKIHHFIGFCFGEIMQPYDSSKLRFIQPWNATYWKQLSIGVESAFEYSSTKRNREVLRYNDYCKSFRRWCQQGLSLGSSWKIYDSTGSGSM